MIDIEAGVHGIDGIAKRIIVITRGHLFGGGHHASAAIFNHHMLQGRAAEIVLVVVKSGVRGSLLKDQKPPITGPALHMPRGKGNRFCDGAARDQCPLDQEDMRPGKANRDARLDGKPYANANQHLACHQVGGLGARPGGVAGNPLGRTCIGKRRRGWGADLEIGCQIDRAGALHLPLQITRR